MISLQYREIFFSFPNLSILTFLACFHMSWIRIQFFKSQVRISIHYILYTAFYIPTVFFSINQTSMIFISILGCIDIMKCFISLYSNIIIQSALVVLVVLVVWQSNSPGRKGSYFSESDPDPSTFFFFLSDRIQIQFLCNLVPAIYHEFLYV